MNIEQIEIETPEHVLLKFNVAGLGSRATAQILDLLILGVINSLLILFVMLLENIIPANVVDALYGYFIAVIIIFYFLIWWGYFVLFEFFGAGKTLGKKIVGIRVIQDNGQSITFLSSIVRNLLRIVDFLPVTYLLGIIMIFFHSKHKRIGDLVAGTIVIYDRKKGKGKHSKRIAREIEKRGLNIERIELTDWARKKISTREWNLLRTYIQRFHTLDIGDRKELTGKVGSILLPLIGLEVNNKSHDEIEDDLLTLYLLLKDEWDY